MHHGKTWLWIWPSDKRKITSIKLKTIIKLKLTFVWFLWWSWTFFHPTQQFPPGRLSELHKLIGVCLLNRSKCWNFVFNRALIECNSAQSKPPISLRMEPLKDDKRKIIKVLEERAAPHVLVHLSLLLVISIFGWCLSRFWPSDDSSPESLRIKKTIRSQDCNVDNAAPIRSSVPTAVVWNGEGGAVFKGGVHIGEGSRGRREETGVWLIHKHRHFVGTKAEKTWSKRAFSHPISFDLVCVVRH